jgi:hypothetical protein
MAITNPVTGTKLKTEFGAGNGSQYIRGGALVPNIAANAAISTTVAGLTGSTFLGAQAYVPMSGSAANVNGSTTSGNFNEIIGSGSISVSNGIPPYTYLTSYVSGASYTLSLATTTAPQFNRPGNPGPGTTSANYKCVVTDSTAATLTLNFTVTDVRL